MAWAEMTAKNSSTQKAGVSIPVEVSGQKANFTINAQPNPDVKRFTFDAILTFAAGHGEHLTPTGCTCDYSQGLPIIQEQYKTSDEPQKSYMWRSDGTFKLSPSSGPGS